MRNVLFIILLFLSHIISAQTLVVGSTGGVFDVSDLGSASYTIPINVPNGVGGMQPSISLNYNSQGGNGIMGMGWSLSAVSAITRVPNNIYNDKKVTGVQLNAEDRFAIDGNRLIVTNMNYGEPTSEYHTELESYRTVTANGQLGTGPSSFTVKDAEGRTFEYGLSTNSRGLIPGKMEPYMWLLEKVSDLNGNSMLYKYSNNAGELYLMSIEYTYPQNGSPAQYSVDFTYDTKPDPQFSYLAGYKIATTLKLNKIAVTQKSPLKYIRTYNLNYALDYYTHLISVTELGNANLEKFSPTVFEYGEESNIHELSPTGLSFDGAVTYISGDYNGDGLSDFITLPKDYNNPQNYNNWDLYLNTGNGFSLTQSVPLGATPNDIKEYEKPVGRNDITSFIDFNGDGKEDFLYRERDNIASGYDKYKIFLSNGSSLNEYATIFLNENYGPLWHTYPLIGDFDGDGKTEVLVLRGSLNVTSTSPLNYIIGENYLIPQGNTYLAPFLWNMPFDAAYTSVSGLTGSKLFVIDYDGDGKSEVLSIWHNNGVNYAQVFRMNVSFDANNKPIIGNPAFVQVATDNYPTLSHDIFPGDFNGDGITDYLTWIASSGWKIAYGNGNGKIGEILNAPAIINKPWVGASSSPLGMRPIIIGDFNGDGKSDIFDFTDNNSVYNWGSPYPPKIHYSKGNNYFEQKDYNIPYIQLSILSSQYTLGDFNGDGSVGLLFDYARSTLAFKPNEKRHLLSKITNGLGVKTKINYQSLVNNSIYDNGSFNYSYPIVKKPLALKVVSSINEDNGLNTVGNTTTFNYKGLKYAFWGRGLLGFDRITQNNTSTLASSEKYYTLNTTYFIPQLTDIVNMVNGTITNMQTNEYGIKDFGNKRIFPYITQTSSTDNITQQNTRTIFDYGTVGVGVPNGFSIGKPFKVTTLKGFKDYLAVVNNNVVLTTSQIEKTVQNFNYPNPYIIIIGQPPLPFYMLFKPTKITTTQNRTGNSDNTRAVSFKYDNSNGKLIESTQDPITANAVTTSLSYNNFGNPIEKSVSAVGLPTVTENYEYDPSQRFVSKIYNSAYPNLSTNNTYESSTGNLLSQTDPDGLATTYIYDAFNRIKTISNNNGTSSSTSYQWATGVPNAIYQVETDDNLSEPTLSYYDRLGRLIKQSNTGFNGQEISKEIAYNVKGQQVSETMPRFATDPVLTTTFQYDLFGRQTQVAAPTGTTTYAYVSTTSTGISNNNSKYKVTVTNAAAQAKSSTSDASGKTTLVEDEGGQIEYSYNSIGATKSTTLNGSVVQTAEYDNFGRNTLTADPNYGNYIYTYNAYNQVLTQKDPKNNIYSFNYDDLGNLGERIGSEGTYTYKYNFTAGPNAFKLTTLIGPEGMIMYNYGKGSQVLSESRRTGPETFTNSYMYDAQGRVKERRYPDGSIISYDYNPYDGSLSHLGVPGETYNTPMGSSPAYIHSITHKNAYGQVIAAGHGSSFYSGTIQNGQPINTKIWSTFGYDQYGLLTSALTKIPGVGGGPGTTLKSFIYDFNAITGNLNSRMDIKYNKSEYFGYDDLNRLRRAQYASPTTFPSLIDLAYADNGNINQKSDAGSFTYDVANRVSKIDPFINIPSTTQYTNYTAFNKIRDITEGSIKAAFTYWPDGERASMEVFGGQNPRKVYYAPGYEKIVKAGNPDRQLSYIDNGNSLVAIMETVGSTQNRYYVLTDYLGSITQILNTNGTIIEEKSFDAWGRPRNPSTWSLNGSGYFGATYASNGWDRGYTGHEHIPEFGIVNMNGRLYDPLMGRMFSPDPYIMGMDNTQGYNRYTYALNNPLTYTDPSGEYVLVDDIVAAAVGGVVNLVSNALQGNLGGHGFWGGVGRGAAAFGSGAVGGWGAIYPQFGGWLWGGAAVGATNAWLSGGTSTGQILQGAIVGGISGVAGGAAGSFAASGISSITSSISSPVINGIIGGATGGAASGYVGGFVGGFLTSGSLSTANQEGLSGMVSGIGIGGVAGGVGGYRYSKQHHLNPWTGRSNLTVEPIQSAGVQLYDLSGRQIIEIETRQIEWTTKFLDKQDAFHSLENANLPKKIYLKPTLGGDKKLMFKYEGANMNYQPGRNIYNGNWEIIVNPDLKTSNHLLFKKK